MSSQGACQEGHHTFSQWILQCLKCWGWGFGQPSPSQPTILPGSMKVGRAMPPPFLELAKQARCNAIDKRTECLSTCIRGSNSCGSLIYNLSFTLFKLKGHLTQGGWPCSSGCGSKAGVKFNPAFHHQTARHRLCECAQTRKFATLPTEHSGRVG